MVVDINGNSNASRYLIGGKGYIINNLFRLNFNVPYGFILTTEAFDYFIDCNSLRSVLKELKNSNTNGKKEICKKIRNLIKKGNLPKDIISEIDKNIIKKGLKDKNLVMRSSGEIEDSSNFSFAGQFKSILNINFDRVEKSIKEIYASAFEFRVIKYCERFSIPIDKLRIAIIFQEFINGEVSGVAFVDPLNNKKIIIEAVS